MPRCVLPLAVEGAAARVAVHALAADLVALPLASVLAAVGPGTYARSFLLAGSEGSCVLHAGMVVPCDLEAMAFPVVLDPIAHVDRAVIGPVDTESMERARRPLTRVDVAIGKGDPAAALRSAVDPFALVARAVRPPLDAEAVPGPALPLACVHRAGPEVMGRPGPAGGLAACLHVNRHLAELREVESKKPHELRHLVQRGGAP
mmetsp:Transcript_13494/g.37368  ORF Transcript_13494/g.37368 Transcript_13494/m.37368 type:complete len:204 (+) Transcript_13494:574-1185(+)